MKKQNCKYSARRLIGSRTIESAAYCNKKLLAHLIYILTVNKTRRLIESSVIVITFKLAQSDSIKRRHCTKIARVECSD
jgi:hypothetical protein